MIHPSGFVFFNNLLLLYLIDVIILFRFISDILKNKKESDQEMQSWEFSVDEGGSFSVL